jgi:hypothetical protein
MTRAFPILTASLLFALVMLPVLAQAARIAA